MLGTTEKEKKISLFFIIVSVGMLIGFIWMTINRCLGLDYPYTTIFFHNGDRYMDFFNVNHFVGGRDPYSTMTSYPPFALLLAYPFSFISRGYIHSVYVRSSMLGKMSFLVFLIFFLIYFAILINKTFSDSSKREKIFYFIGFLFSYPILYALDRGNYLLFTFMFLGVFFYYYDKNKFIANLSLAAAIATKIYPAAFLLLYFSDKRFKDIFKTLFNTLLLTYVSLLFFRGSMLNNLENFFYHLFVFGSSSNSEIVGISFQNSLMALIKIIYKLNQQPLPNGLFLNYFLFILFSGLFLAYIIYREKQFWLKILLITSYQIIIPPMSFDYNLVFLIFPVIALFHDQSISFKASINYLVLISLLFIPKVYWVLIPPPNGEFEKEFYLSIQPILNPIILVSILLLGFYSSIRNRKMNADL